MPFSEPYIFFASILVFAIAVARYWCWIEKSNDRGEKWVGNRIGVDMMRDMGVWEYLLSLVILTVVGAGAVFLTGVLQGILPCNPEGFGGLSFLQAMHLAASVASHTNWQPWAPEATYSIFTQAVAVNTQNLLQAGVGIASMRALLRALRRQSLGNAWGAIYRGVVWLHLPLWILGACFLIASGTPQNPFAGQIDQGPVASFAALKVLSGGAGYFSQNFASAIENPTGFTNGLFLTMFIGFPLGVFLGAGRYLRYERVTDMLALAILMVLFGAALINTPDNIDPQLDRYSGFTQSLWFHATAGNSNGSLNTSIERFEPEHRLMGFLTMVGGLPFPPPVGFGVNTILLHLMLALYLASLMVGANPVFRGYWLSLKILLIILVALMANQLLTLISTAILFLTPEAMAILQTQGPYGTSTLLYTVSTAVQNNGSAYSLPIGDQGILWGSILLMILGRIFVIAPGVLIAGEFFKQKSRPALPVVINVGSPLFVGFWILLMISGVVLAFSPLMMLGPIMEALP